MFLLCYGAKFIFRICFLRDNLQYIYSLKFKFCFALKIFSRNLLLNICVVMLSKKKTTNIKAAMRHFFFFKYNVLHMY